jgi:integrase/recombinase XerD
MSTPLLAEIGTLQNSCPGPLACHLPAFTSLMYVQGYTTASLRSKIKVVRNFSRWMEKRQLQVSELDEPAIDVFFKEHPRAGFVRRGDLSTLHWLIEWLRDVNVTRALLPQIFDTEVHSIVSDFAQYLEKERGLSQMTLRNYLPVIHCFLSECFGSDLIMLSKVSASDVIQFVLHHARLISCRRVQLMTTALRGFFRFLRYRGDITSDLAASVPTVADWRLSELPKSLAPGEVEHLLLNCDQSTAIGQRDYAVLLLLARLGLRAGEVVAMTLDDINWDTGVVTIRGKGARRDQLPILQDVGEALVAYLRHGRPPCATRRVFIRARAPHRGFSGSAAIDNIVRRALARAELDPIRKGAHLLRHSLATEMLRRGSSLAEIGEILRHSTPNTTEIYTKVDLAALSELAQPWPGGEV